MVTYEAVIAAHRFGLGAAPGDLERISNNLDGWLEEQLRAPVTMPSTLASVPSSLDAIRAWRSMRQMRNKSRRKDALVRDARQNYRRTVEARMWIAVTSDTPLVERMVWFWSNHFAISVNKHIIAPLAVNFEREAIRPNLFDKFAELLLAVTKHPAMLVFLDNVTSFGPNSRIGWDRGAGLNENLAREILELHTMGVNGGYAQADVEALAAVLTGWTVPLPAHRKAANDAFIFLAEAHEPGSKTLLGKRYPDAGIEQGEQALRNLATHPSTARFIAQKLARHFCTDDPPKATVDELAHVFNDTGGDLQALMRAVVSTSEAWSRKRRKLRTPAELVVASARALGMAPRDKPVMFQSLKLLNHLPLAAPSPAGYPDFVSAWSGPEAVIQRIEWCTAAAFRSGVRTRPDKFAREILGPAVSSHTINWISRIPSQPGGIAMVLASPEFQWR